MKLWKTIGAAALAAALLAGCAGGGSGADAEPPSRVYYEIFVRSFYDTNGDGVGDLNGVTEKLDYLETLGAEGIWLMPINASPSYHGYDVTDYYAVNPDYGTLDDMKRLLSEAGKRDIKVLMDLVVNHTSVQHPWFLASAQGSESEKRDWYVWADPETNANDLSATGSGKAWHANDGGHYLGVFWDGMPDLNFDNPAVREEMKKIGSYWLELGVDGFRLDAAKHIYENVQADANHSEKAEANVAWWQEFRAAMEETNPDVTLIGEVWDAPAVVAPYFDGAMSSAFNFELASQLLSMTGTGSSANVASRLERIYGLYEEASGGAFTDSIFLANHDQNRVMTVLNGDEGKARAAAALLLTLPGNPFLYYGEEIGMRGAKPDEYIREPIPWTVDRTAPGNASWMIPKHNGGEAASVEEAMADDASLFHHYRRLIEYRKKDAALRGGALRSLKVGGGLESFLRETEDGDASLVLHNVTANELSVDLAETEEAKPFDSLAFATSADASLEGAVAKLPPYSVMILKK
ncbi:alpha-amylase family glycosyl hydrolase [Paenibacillus sp.]|uniref:alpha-amylase family glycosyl hydrolase n=1 Tax=Paenibacillus sp. TaxID=58172 RepID=UPI002810D3C5|nr:alpha-amylase family glycosyl hydrolase [Paenibacillus sp.]